MSSPALAALAALAAPLFTVLPSAHAQDAGAAASSAPDGATPAPEVAAEPSEPAAEPAPEAAPNEPAPAPTDVEAAPGPVLEPPTLAPLELDATTAAAQQNGQKAPPVAPPVEKRELTLPETVFHLHGYLRMRGNLLKDGALGHSPEFDRLQTGGRQNYDPFPFFRPADSVSRYTSSGNPSDDRNDAGKAAVQGGCNDTASSGDGNCKKSTQVGGDLRLRLKPEIHLSDDIRVKAWVDVLDNVGLGTLGYGAQNQYSPDSADLGNAIRVRRAWGEARNRDIGELRFGRMGADWGLGILDNGGDRNGIDSDFSSDVDRVMAITNLAGFYFMGAFDWAQQGVVQPGRATPSGVPVDRAQRDDLSALTLSAAHRMDRVKQTEVLRNGDAVFNYGLYFIWRRQRLKERAATELESNTDLTQFYRYDQKQFVPDLWFQVMWEGLRVEMEAAFVAGTMQGSCPMFGNTDARISRSELRPGDQALSTDGECRFRQLGIALETEYRLFDERLGIHFLSGMATGDSNAYGLAATNDPSYQDARQGNDSARTISTYQFHPDYRVDLILWRTLMRRVAGGYYFKPGVSYDFIHDSAGQLAGARVDMIYSRAMAAKQTYGGSGNLGLELDVSLYYRSEDGPDPLDGFYSTLQWGILFPFQGLDYAGKDAPSAGKNAMILRGVVGIAF